MKKLIFTLGMLLLPFLATAQNTKSKVVLKNGTEITGVIKSIDPTDAVKIVIAGVETSIKMADIAKIEELEQNTSNMSSPANEETELKEKLRVTDFADYPESFDLKVGDQTIKMILVRGGDMNMGYSGRHSLNMESEPVHKVKVTSFYISETFVTNSMANYVRGKDYKNGYFTASWKNLNETAQLIAKESGIPVRLPTEAEWEYAACSSQSSIIFKECQEVEYCSDYFDKFDNLTDVVDPVGPSKGSKHVVRAYNIRDSFYYGKFDRTIYPTFDKHMRLVIKAKDFLENK